MLRRFIRRMLRKHRRALLNTNVSIGGHEDQKKKLSSRRSSSSSISATQPPINDSRRDQPEDKVLLYTTDFTTNSASTATNLAAAAAADMDSSTYSVPQHLNQLIAPVPQRAGSFSKPASVDRRLGHHQHQRRRVNKSQPNLLMNQPPPPPSSVSNHECCSERKQARMRVISCPSVHVVDLFKSLLCAVPRSDEIFQALAQYGDSINATSIKFLLNERDYEDCSLIRKEYSKYQGSALCAYFDKVLTEQQWEQIFLIQANNNQFCTKNTPASSFLSLFHISDFVTIASGRKVAFIDPSERISDDERSFVALFDLDDDCEEVRILADQFKPIFDAPLVSMRSSSGGTMIRLPLRCCQHKLASRVGYTYQCQRCNRRGRSSDKSFLTPSVLTSERIIEQAQRFADEFAQLTLMFARSLTSISFYRSSDGRIYQQLFSMNLEFLSDLEKDSMHKLIDGAISNSDYPTGYTTTVMFTNEQQDFTDCQRWVLSALALNDNVDPYALKIAFPLGLESDCRLIDRNSCIKYLLSTQSHHTCVRCFRMCEDRMFAIHLEPLNPFHLVESFSKSSLSEALESVKFAQAYSICLRQLTLRADIDLDTIWSLMPAFDEANGFASTIWRELVLQELFFSQTDGWGFVAVDDMIVNQVEDRHTNDILQETITHILAESNEPVVQPPKHVLNALLSTELDGTRRPLQTVTPTRISNILRTCNSNESLTATNGIMLSLSQKQKCRILEYFLEEGDPNLLQGLQLLPLASGEFIQFSDAQPAVYVCQKPFDEHLFSHLRDRLLSTDILSPEMIKSIASMEGTQIKPMPDTQSEFADLVMIPKEWRRGEDVVRWSKHHDYYNIHWLENLWKYIRDKMPTDLSPIENFNLLYVTNSREQFMVLYKISKDSTLLYCSKEQLLDPLFSSMQRIMLKLGIEVVDGFPDVITHHPDFHRFVQPFNSAGVLGAMRNKMRRTSLSACSKFLSQTFNNDLSPKEVATVRTFFCKYFPPTSNEPDIELLRAIPMFVDAIGGNGGLECREQFVSVDQTFLCYSNGPKCPPVKSSKSIIFAQDKDSRVLVERLGQRISDFNSIARHVVATAVATFHDERNGMSSSIVATGKWILAHCAGIILADTLCQESLSKARLFQNRKLELCSPSEMIDPTFRERFVSVLSTRLLPNLDLITEGNISLLKMMKLRNIYDVTADELVEACELSRTFTLDRRRVLANLLVDVLTINDRLLNEYVNNLAVGKVAIVPTFKAFIHTFPWVPVMQQRPSGYPSSLIWMAELKKTGTTSPAFIPLPESVDRSLAFVAGSVVQISELDIETLEHKSRFQFKELTCTMVVRHLKNIVHCFQAVSASAQDRTQYFDYMNVTKKCYDVLCAEFDPPLIVKELTNAELDKWIWNGRGGFSSTDEIISSPASSSDSVLSPYFFNIPTELQCLAKFFEMCGVSCKPHPQAMLRLLSSNQSYYPPVKTNQKLFQWIRDNYTDRRILTALQSSIGAPLQEDVHYHENQIRIWIPAAFDVGSNREMLRSAVMTVRPDKEVWIGVGNVSNPTVDWSHYRLYEELILPNLQTFSRNIKDALVLLALDHCDVSMMNILREHSCIPVTPNGCRLRHPRDLIHPRSPKLRSLYSEGDGVFPYGNKETYLREDRLEVLRLLGMRMDQISWRDLVERSERICDLNAASTLLDVIAEKLAGGIEDDEKTETAAAMSSLINQCIVPVKPRPSSYPIAWAGDRLVTRRHQLARPCDMIESKHEFIAGSSFPVVDTDLLSSTLHLKLLFRYLNFHEPTLNDVLNQLKEVITAVNASAPVCELPDKTAIELQPILRSCYAFIHKQSQFPDFNHAIIKDFFARNAILLIGTSLYASTRIFMDVEYSVFPHVVSANSTNLDCGFVRNVLGVRAKPDVAFIREAMMNVKKGDINDAVRIVNLLPHHRTQLSLNDLLVPLQDNRLVPVNNAINERIHPLVDLKVCQMLGLTPPPSSSSTQSMAPSINVQDEALRDVLTYICDRFNIEHQKVTDKEPERILDILLSNPLTHYTDPMAILMYFDRSLQNATMPISVTGVRDLPLFRAAFSSAPIGLKHAKRVFVINETSINFLLRVFQQTPLPESTAILHFSHASHSRLNQHLRFVHLSDADTFVQLVMPFMTNLTASPGQLSAIIHLRDVVFPSIPTEQERIRLLEIIQRTLHLRNRRDVNVPLLNLYRPTVIDLKPPLIDPNSELPHIDLAPVYDFLPLRTVLESTRLRNLMQSIEHDVVAHKQWTRMTREKSRLLCEHVQNHLRHLEDKTVLDIPFLEPQTYDSPLCQLVKCYETSDEPVVLSLRQGVIDKFMPLVWSSAFVLPKCVNGDLLEAIPRAELNSLMVRVDPPLNLVIKNLTNIADALVKFNPNAQTLESKAINVDVAQDLLPILERSYDYLRTKLGDSQVDDEIRSKPIVYTPRTQQLVPATRICVNLKNEEEIPPFIYSIPPSLIDRGDFFIKLGANDRPSAELYANILAQMARVCRNDFLNSNEVKKALKAMTGLFACIRESKQTEINSFKFTGLFLLANDLKMHRAADVVLVESRSKLDYVRKISDDLFLFNPSECVLRLDVPLPTFTSWIYRISTNQRPQLFSEKYQESFSMAIPEDREGKRQQILHAIERKYTQLLQSRTLHRCLSRALSDTLARKNSSVCVTIDQMELYLRTRFALLNLVCVEHLETSLSYKTTQQRIDATIEEKAVYLASSETEDLTLYLSLRHAEQPYFPACLAKAIVPLLVEVKAEPFVLCSLLSSSITHMSRILDLFGITPEESILSTLKLHYVPAPGRIYADDVTLLCKYDPRVHRLIPGDLCVYRRTNQNESVVEVPAELYIYCTFVQPCRDDRTGEVTNIGIICSTNVDDLGDETVVYDERQPLVEYIPISDFYVLENWSRVHDAAYAQPLDDQEEELTRSSTGNSNSESGSLTDEERVELDATRTLIDAELREVFFASRSIGDDRKRKVKRMLLKWHPDKNQGREKFASEVFKYLRKQIEMFDLSEPLTPYAWMSNSFCAPSNGGTDAGASGNKFGGSYDNLHKNSESPSSSKQRGSTPSTTTPEDFFTSMNDNARYSHAPHSGSVSPPGRSNSFRTAREEWQWKRQHGFNRRAGFFNKESATTNSTQTSSGINDFGSRKPWTNGIPKANPFTNTSDAQRWLRQASCDLRAAANDMVPPVDSDPSYEWVCYKCYRAAEKALKALHLTKSAGTVPATDLPTLLYGVEDDVRIIGYNLYRWLGDANRMQYPNMTRISKTPNEIFTQKQAERSLECTKELLDRISAIVGEMKKE